MNHVTEFKRLTANILADIESLKGTLNAIMLDENRDEIIESLNELDERKVTLLEPAMLKIRLQEALDLCADLTLIEYVNRRDPSRLAHTSGGINWFVAAKTPGRVTVDAIKAIRECLDPRYVSIAEGKRICELILEGKIN